MQYFSPLGSCVFPVLKWNNVSTTCWAFFTAWRHFLVRVGQALWQGQQQRYSNVEENITGKQLVGAACFLAAHIKAIFYLFFSPLLAAGSVVFSLQTNRPGCEWNPAEATSSGQFRGSMGFCSASWSHCCVRTHQNKLSQRGKRPPCFRTRPIVPGANKTQNTPGAGLFSDFVNPDTTDPFLWTPPPYVAQQ